MRLLKDAIDYAKRGHIFFREPSLRNEVFSFLEETLKDLADKRTAEGAGIYIQPVINLLERKKTFLITPDEELWNLSKNFFIRNVDLILRLSALAKDGYERFPFIYMTIKFIPEFVKELKDVYRLMIKTYAVLIHTICNPELYKKGGCIEVAVKGLYRLDGEDLIDTWGKDELVLNITSQLTEEEKRINPKIKEWFVQDIEKLLENKKNLDDLLEPFAFLLFTKNFLTSVQLWLFKNHKKDVFYELVQKIKDKLIKKVRSAVFELLEEEKFISELTSFLEKRPERKYPYITNERTQVLEEDQASLLQFLPVQI